MEKESCLSVEEEKEIIVGIAFHQQNKNSPSSQKTTSSEKTLSSDGENYQAMSLSEGDKTASEEDSIKSQKTMSVETTSSDEDKFQAMSLSEKHKTCSKEYSIKCKKMIFAYEEEDESSEDSEELEDLEETDGTRRMTRKESIEYDKQVFETDGFDVKAIPRVHEIGQIQPRDLSVKNRINECALDSAMYAVKFFNDTSYKIVEGELEFDKLEMVTSHAVCGIKFYLTFTAKNVKEGRIITYQSKVVYGAQPEFQVLSFRRKPADPTGADKEWIWTDDIPYIPSDCSGSDCSCSDFD